MAATKLPRTALGRVASGGRTWRIVAAAVLVAVAAVGACSGNAVPTTVAETAPPTTLSFSSPEAAVGFWLNALQTGEFSRAGRPIDETQLVLFLSLENASAAYVDELLSSGIPANVAENFWRSFADNVEVFAGGRLGELAVADTETFSVRGVPYAAVEVTHADGSSELMAVQSDDKWTVDLFASFGGGVAQLFDRWLEILGTSAEAAPARDALASQATSLSAALARLGSDDTAAMTEIRMLLAELESSTG